MPQTKQKPVPLIVMELPEGAGLAGKLKELDIHVSGAQIYLDQECIGELMQAASGRRMKRKILDKGVQHHERHATTEKQ